MKPMLERKRRARINRCLDELKELLVGALQSEGESVSRLEKADVLELTVRHLHKLRRSQALAESGAADRFRAGFVHCANEVTKYCESNNVNPRLITHLENCITTANPPQISPGLYTPPSSPVSSSSSSGCSSGGNFLKLSSSLRNHPYGNHHMTPVSMVSPGYPSSGYPLSLCTKQDEPFDLSAGSDCVWRPW